MIYLILLSSWRSLQMSESFGECGEYRCAGSPVNGHASPQWQESRKLQFLGVDLMDSLSLPCHFTKIILHHHSVCVYTLCVLFSTAITSFQMKHAGSKVCQGHPCLALWLLQLQFQRNYFQCECCSGQFFQYINTVITPKRKMLFVLFQNQQCRALF